MGELVEFKANGGTGSGYLAIPRAGRGFQQGPGVIVIQEWWGLVDHIKDVCERFANEGFVALAPDLYHGKATKSPDEAGKLMMALNIDQAEKDLSGAVGYLLDHDAVTGDKVGVVGFCMGGALTIAAAVHAPEFAAGVCFYGIPTKEFADPAKIKIPLQGHFANQDDWCTPQAVNELEKAMIGAGQKPEIHRYDAAHAFANERSEAYDVKCANQAWERMLGFLKKTL